VLDPDLKGYFKTVEEQIKDWEGGSSIGEEREGESSSTYRFTCIAAGFLGVERHLLNSDNS
jgi:hypothetical protein